MAGIQFFKTAALETVVSFYRDRIGMKVWLEQGDYVLLSHGNFILGFGQSPEAETQGCITFYYPEKANVDSLYERLGDCARGAPKTTETYRIYNFFADDPEGRTVEGQAFLHPVSLYPGGGDLLLERRSIRAFKDTPVPDDLLDKVFESCRFAPTSMHSESFYYVMTRSPEALKVLSAARGSASAPVGRAPLAVAVCSDPERSGAYEVNGHIAAYHLILAAKVYGLGSCWIGSMNRQDVKEALQIPPGHFVACVTPLGWPDETPDTRPRRPRADLVRVV